MSGAFEDGEQQSWAGQLESCLNVTAETLLDSIKTCWASAFSARAVAYQASGGAAIDRARLGVVVQRMLASDKAGVAFSIHPVTGESDQLVIEAVRGLGEAIVGGEVTPERHVLDKATLGARERVPHRQQRRLVRRAGGGTRWVDLPPANARRPVLVSQEVRKLGQLTRALEGAFGGPVDVEWAITGKTLYLLQCRPITSAPPPRLTLDDLPKFRWMFCHVRERSPFFMYLLFGGQTRLRLDLGFDYRLAHSGVFLHDIVVCRADEDRLCDIVRNGYTPIPRCCCARCTCAFGSEIASRAWAALARPAWTRRSPRALADGLQTYVDSVLPFSAFIDWVAAFDVDLSALVEARLTSHLGKRAGEQAFAVVSDPVRSGIVLLERAAILAIAIAAKRGRRVDQRLARHAERFGWMKNVGYLGDWHPSSYYEDELGSDVGDPSAELETLQQHEQRRKASLSPHCANNASPIARWSR